MARKGPATASARMPRCCEQVASEDYDECLYISRSPLYIYQGAPCIYIVHIYRVPTVCSKRSRNRKRNFAHYLRAFYLRRPVPKLPAIAYAIDPNPNLETHGVSFSFRSTIYALSTNLSLLYSLHVSARLAKVGR